MQLPHLNNKYFKNTGWLLGEKLIRFVVLLFVATAVARYLGPRKLGVYNFAQSYVNLFLFLATLGLDTVVVQELLRKEEQVNEILGTSFVLKLFSGIFTLGALLVTGRLLGFDEIAIKGIIIIGATYILQSLNVIDFYFQSKVQSKYIVFANFISLILASLLKVYGIYANLDLFYFFLIFAIEVFVYILFFIFFYHRSGQRVFAWKFSMTQAKSLLSQSFPLILSGVTVTLYMKIDQFMIKEMLSYEDVGFYTAGTKLVEVWHIIPMVVVGSFFPSIVNSYKDREKDAATGELYKNRLQALYGGLIFGSLLLAIVTTLLSEHIILLLYGTTYAQSSGVLSFSIWSSVFIFLGVANSKWYIIMGLQKIAFYITLISAIVNISLNFIFIPRLGIIGASIATLISSAVASYFAMFLFYRICKENIALTTKSFNPFKVWSYLKDINSLK